MKKKYLGLILLLLSQAFLGLSIIFGLSLISEDQEFSEICYETLKFEKDNQFKMSDCLNQSQEIRDSSKLFAFFLTLTMLVIGLSFFIQGVKFIKSSKN